jgi:gamma-glutamyltranspeptidase/glutathione hydrolase
MKYFLVWCMVVLTAGSLRSQKIGNELHPFHYLDQKVAEGRNGVVVTAHPLASEAGVLVMKQGGNAFDAAIAAQLALAVVYSNAGNIGGGGFMVARTAGGKGLALDYREMAPTHAARDMYLDEKGNVIPGKSINGHLSSGVPGTVAGLFEILPYAKLPFRRLIQPAIDLAEKGFTITQREADALNSIQKDLAAFNTAANVFQRTSWHAGDTLMQPDLANTLKRIRDAGRAGFYEGETAALIVAEMKRGHGLITLDDLKKYKAIWRTPETFSYRGYTIVSMPLPSSGGILLHQMFKMVQDKPLASYGFLSPLAVQLMAEVERRAYADRAEYLGDADFYKVPRATLISDKYIQHRMADYVPGKAGSSKEVQPGKIPAKESEETTHLSIIDGGGNMVSITTTLNNSYGSKTVVGGAGFFMNDEMDDFSAKPGTPNLYGAVGGEANAIAPGKRMLSSMSPAIVLNGKKPFMVVGTPGGTTITTSVFQTIVDIVDFKLSPENAVNKPKFHHQWLPDELYVERSFPKDVREALEQMGYKITERSAIGRTEVIQASTNGRYKGVADSRGDDGAAAY